MRSNNPTFVCNNDNALFVQFLRYRHTSSYSQKSDNLTVEQKIYRWKELFFVRVDFFCREICYDVQIANFPRLLQITVIDQMQNLKSGQRRFSCTCTLPRPKSNWDQNRARSHKAWTWTWLFENKIWAWKNKKSHLAIVGMPRKKYCLRFGVRLITFC